MFLNQNTLLQIFKNFIWNNKRMCIMINFNPRHFIVCYFITSKNSWFAIHPLYTDTVFFVKLYIVIDYFTIAAYIIATKWTIRSNVYSVFIIFFNDITFNQWITAYHLDSVGIIVNGAANDISFISDSYLNTWSRIIIDATVFNSCFSSIAYRRNTYFIIANYLRVY